MPSLNNPMRSAGLVLAIAGGFVALFMSMLFGLIIVGLGLIIISLNKEDKNHTRVDKNNSVIPYKEKTSGYFYWSKTKLGKWSNLVNNSLIFVGSLFALVFFAYSTIQVENEEIKNVNCGIAVLFTDYFLEPLFNSRTMYEDFCVNK
jgi:hypothetical protein